MTNHSACHDMTGHRQGYTLLEMLLIIGFLVLMAAFVWPVMTRFRGRHEADQGAEQLMAALTTARIEAMRSGVPYVLEFQPGESRYRIVPRELDAINWDDAGQRSGADAPPMWRLQEELPGRVTFEGALPDEAVVTGEGAMEEGSEQGGEREWSTADESVPLETTWDEADELPLIALWPDGTATPVRILLRHERQGWAVVVLDELTGVARLGQSALRSEEKR